MLFKVALPSLMAFIPVVLGGCYSGGQPFPDDHTATINAIESAGAQFAADSPLSTGEHVLDFNIEDVVLHFVLDNVSGGARSITADEAVDGFTKEYHGCQYGGDTKYANWRYVLDPNAA